MNGLGCAVAAVALGFLLIVATSARGKGCLGLVGLLLTGGLALGSAGLAVFLAWVGHKAHWTSDGPAMLFVMIGILVGGGAAFFFGSLFFSQLSGGPPGE